MITTCTWLYQTLAHCLWPRAKERCPGSYWKKPVDRRLDGAGLDESLARFLTATGLIDFLVPQYPETGNSFQRFRVNECLPARAG